MRAHGGLEGLAKNGQKERACYKIRERVGYKRHIPK